MTTIPVPAPAPAVESYGVEPVGSLAAHDRLVLLEDATIGAETFPAGALLEIMDHGSAPDHASYIDAEGNAHPVSLALFGRRVPLPGALVEIAATRNSGSRAFLGLRARVIETGAGSDARLDPLDDRPDGNGRLPFYWPRDLLRMVDPAPECMIGPALTEEDAAGPGVTITEEEILGVIREAEAARDVESIVRRLRASVLSGDLEDAEHELRRVLHLLDASGEEARQAAREATERADRLAEDVEAERARSARTRAAHEEDLRIVGEALAVEAQERDWCGEYERVLDALSDRLTEGETFRAASRRTRRYRATLTLEVDARDEDAARDEIASAVYSWNRAEIVAHVDYVDEAD